MLKTAKGTNGIVGGCSVLITPAALLVKRQLHLVPYDSSINSYCILKFRGGWSALDIFQTNGKKIYAYDGSPDMLFAKGDSPALSSASAMGGKRHSWMSAPGAVATK